MSRAFSGENQFDENPKEGWRNSPTRHPTIKKICSFPKMWMIILLKWNNAQKMKVMMSSEYIAVISVALPERYGTKFYSSNFSIEIQ